MADPNYKYLSGIIKNKRNQNVKLVDLYRRADNRIQDDSLDSISRRKLEQKRNKLKGYIVENSNSIDFMNKKYFPKNKR